MNIKDYVRAIRDEFFEGGGRTIYFNAPDELQTFTEDAPIDLYEFGVPDIPAMAFPIAIIYSEKRAFWVDSDGHLWSCGPKYCRFIVSKEWMPS